MGSSGGGSSSGVSTQTNFIRYAGYLEDRHKSFLSDIFGVAGTVRNDSPFSGFTPLDIDDAFFGAGMAITNFSALFSVCKDFMLDITPDSLFSTISSSTLNSDVSKDLVLAESALLNDDIETNALPRILAGARDINSVMSSTFIIARTNIEATRLKALGKFSAELKYRLIPVAVDRWKTRLAWNKDVVMTYAEMIKLYFSGKMDVTEQNYTFLAKNKLWPFTVFDYERAALGAMQGATTSNKEVSGSGGPSQVQKAIGGALSGAAAGAAATGGNPIGAAIGGAIGLGASFM